MQLRWKSKQKSTAKSGRNLLVKRADYLILWVIVVAWRIENFTQKLNDRKRCSSLTKIVAQQQWTVTWFWMRERCAALSSNHFAVFSGCPLILLHFAHFSSLCVKVVSSRQLQHHNIHSTAIAIYVLFRHQACCDAKWKCVHSSRVHVTNGIFQPVY